MSHLRADEIKVPVEALSFHFRKLQKHLSKEVENEVNNINALDGQFDMDNYDGIKARLHTLRALIINCDGEEKKYLSKIQTRSNAVMSKVLTPEDKVMILVCDYLLHQHEFDCVQHIIAEYGPCIEEYLDIDEFKEAYEVEMAISSDDLSTVLNWCKAHASKLRRINSVLEFYLAQERFLELVYANNPQEALQYAQTHLAGLVNSCAGAEPDSEQGTSSSSVAAKPGDKRIRAATMGSYEPTSSTASRGSGKESAGSCGRAQEAADSDHKAILRHLTGLLLYPASSPEVLRHPQFGPHARPGRLKHIMDVFQADFRNVYGIGETSTLETFLTIGIAVTKTPTCSTFLEDQSSTFACGDVLSSTRSSDISPSSPRSPRPATVVGATLNRLWGGRSSGQEATNSTANSRGDSRNRFLRGFSGIGGLLNMPSQRGRSHSMSAVEENLNSISSSASSSPGHSAGSNMSLDKIVPPLRPQPHSIEMETEAAPPSMCDVSARKGENRVTGGQGEMPEHPCYYTNGNEPIKYPGGALQLTGGKRRAGECPVCSGIGGVGASLASSVPSFVSPVSVLVCRGSGKVMNHENPPMALPNGQVFSRDFLLATAIKKNVRTPSNVKMNDNITVGNDDHCQAIRRPIQATSIHRMPPPSLTLRRLIATRNASADFAGRERSSHSSATSLSSRAPVLTTNAPAQAEVAEAFLRVPVENSHHETVSWGDDGILRSRNSAAVTRPTPVQLRVSPIRGIQSNDTTARNRTSPSRPYFLARPTSSRLHAESATPYAYSSPVSQGMSADEEEEEELMSDSAIDEDEDNGSIEHDEEYSGDEEEDNSAAEESDDDIHINTARSRDEISLRTGNMRSSWSDGESTVGLACSNDGKNGAASYENAESVIVVCPVTGEHFDFSLLRIVFLA